MDTLKGLKLVIEMNSSYLTINRFWSTEVGKLTIPRFAVNTVRLPRTPETQLG